MRRPRDKRLSPLFVYAVLLAGFATSSPRLARAADEATLEDPFAKPGDKKKDSSSDEKPPEEKPQEAPAKPAEKPAAPSQEDYTPSKPTPPPRLEDASSKHASLEMAVYDDFDHVTVISPSISMGIENVTAGASIHGSYLVDVVSAASVDIVSTASRAWHEVRNVGAFDAEYKPHDFGVSVGASVSSEPDYLSVGGGAAISKDFDEKNTTLQAGYGYSHDTIGRSSTPFAVFSRTVDRSTFNLGVSQVIDKATIGQLSGDLVVEDGDQSKPYRYIPMFTSAVAAATPAGASIAWVTANRLPERPLEQLPLTKQRFALTGRIGHRFEGSTIRGEERVYYDSWGLAASTTDGRWMFDLGRRFTIWPHLRFHIQDSVSFWQRAYVSDPNGWSLPEYRTGDRELGPLRTYTGGFGVQWFIGSDADPSAWSLSLQTDTMYTQFLDDLYLTGRTGAIGSLTLEGEL
jgi:hypothetical protein